MRVRWNVSGPFAVASKSPVCPDRLPSERRMRARAIIDLLSRVRAAWHPFTTAVEPARSVSFEMPDRTNQLRADAAAGVATLAYGAVLNRLLPEAVHVPTSLAAATAWLAAARRAGVSIAGLGLAPDRLGAGLRTGVAVAAPIVAGIGTASRVPVAAPYFDDARVRDFRRGRAAYEAVIRIPIATALGEELIFRGALLGLFGRKRSTTVAVAASSLLFGIWHVLPTLESLAANSPENGDHSAAHKLGVVAGTVAATAAAGVGFALLRLRSGSVLAPAIVHAAINSSAFVAARQNRPAR
jgi:CAAX protease family protein